MQSCSLGQRGDQRPAETRYDGRRAASQPNAGHRGDLQKRGFRAATQPQRPRPREGRFEPLQQSAEGHRPKRRVGENQVGFCFHIFFCERIFQGNKVKVASVFFSVKRQYEETEQKLAVLEESFVSVQKEVTELRSCLRDVERSRLEARRELQELRRQVAFCRFQFSPLSLKLM